ncbi:anti-sigma factor [Streptomyces sp. NBC_01217]|uniref:anti-sigma factor n=1 Tax=Streptomyces sp. NBC_01217 TaxID=2903779 RepID=UPI002E126AA2|nr:anti-sigma factor [Streptomyces sp. NBC_01217]
MITLGRLLGRDRHALAAPYVLDALEPDERRQFERHLDGCPRCAGEVRTLAEGVVRLALPTTTPAPPAMRERVLTAIRTTARADNSPEPVAGPRQQQSPPPAAAQGPRIRRPLLVPLALGTAVMSLVAAVLFAVQAVRADDQLAQERARTQAITSVLAAPDARATSGGGIGVVASATQGRAVVTVTGLGTPPTGKVHQLWLMTPDTPPRSLGLLHGDTPLIATGLKTTTTSLAVTTEPAGGSQQPTTTPIAQLAL